MCIYVRVCIILPIHVMYVYVRVRKRNNNIVTETAESVAHYNIIVFGPAD